MHATLSEHGHRSPRFDSLDLRKFSSYLYSRVVVVQVECPLLWAPLFLQRNRDQKIDPFSIHTSLPVDSAMRPLVDRLRLCQSLSDRSPVSAGRQHNGKLLA